MMIGRPQKIITETGQRAVIWHDGTSETLILSTQFRGDASEFAWVIPVPNKPEVTKAKDELFTALEEYTRPKYSDAMPVPLVGRGLGGVEDSGAPSVTVVETKKIDIYDIAVLEASEGTALREWLEANGFEYPATKQHLLQYYVDKNWYFVAVKVAGEALGYADSYLNNGHATPLAITFASEMLVYPLKISGAAARYVDGEKNYAYSFEKGVGGWAARGRIRVAADGATPGEFHTTRISLANSHAIHGQNSLKVENAEGTPEWDYAYFGLSNLVPGKTYVYSAYASVAEVSSATAKLRVSEGGPYIAETEEQRFSTGQMSKRLSVTFVPSGSTAKIELLAHNLKMAEAVYWDGVQVEMQTTPSEFTDEVTISSANRGDEYVNVTLYVFANHKKFAPGFSTVYAGDLPAKDIERLAVDDDGKPWMQSNKKMYLTKLTRNMQQSEMTDDVILRDAGDNTAVGGVNIGLGGSWRPVLVFGGLIVGEVLVIYYFWYSRKRKVNKPWEA